MTGFHISPSIKFHGNPSSGSCADTCRQPDKTKAIGAFWDYADTRKKAADCRKGVVHQFGGEGVEDLDEGLTSHRMVTLRNVSQSTGTAQSHKNNAGW